MDPKGKKTEDIGDDNEENKTPDPPKPSYYYDDAYGYEDYEPESDEEEAEENQR